MIICSQIGFLNFRNTCYANVCNQILLHSDLLCVFINNFINRMKNNISSTNEKVISYKFYLIIKEILEIFNLDYYLNLSSFLYSFGNKHKTYEGHLQHDCQEFCRMFLDDINKELNENKRELL